MSSAQQYVTIVAQGGTPVRLADQKGTPYPTTGQGSLVFSNGPTLNNPVLINPIFDGIPVNEGVPYKSILDFNPLANTGDGTAGTEAWADLLEYCNTHKVAGYLPSGTYLILTAPGIIPDPAAQNCPQVNYNYINLFGDGQDVVTVVCRPAATATNPNIITSRPILKAVANNPEESLFSIRGITLDGGNTNQFLMTSNGPDPDSCALLEVRNYNQVVLDIALTRFAQNWDTSNPDNGNFGRRGPMLIWGNQNIDVTYKLIAPSIGEGPFFGNNVIARVRPIYRGPADNVPGSGNVSTPFNYFSRSADPAVGGEYLFIDQPDIAGCWTGSAGNIYIPGDIVFLGGPILRGSITTENLTTGSPRSPDDYNWGAGWDFGAEVAIGPTRSIHLENANAEELMRDGWKFTRTADTRIGTLTGSASLDNGFDGLYVYYVDYIDFSFKARKILWYVPDFTAAGGIAVRMRHCGTGNLQVDIDGSQTAIYNYPNSTPPSTGNVPRISRMGVWKEYSSGVVISGRIKDCAGYLIWENVEDAADTGIYDARWADLAFETDVYPVSNLNGGIALIRLGFGSTRKLRNLIVSGCSYNGQPLILSGQFRLGLPVNPVEGLQQTTLGNPLDPLAQDDVLSSYLAYSGDLTSDQQGIRAKIEARAAGSDGTGGYWTFLTSTGADAPVRRFSIKGNGLTNFVGLATAPLSLEEGDAYYDSTLQRQRFWDGTEWARIGFRVASGSSSGDQTPNANTDGYEIPSVTGDLNFVSPTGIPANFQILQIRIEDESGAHNITWDVNYRAGSISLPSVTSAGTTYLTFSHDSLQGTWDLISMVDGFTPWTPADLGASLYAWWDAERADLITETAGAVSSWQDVVAGYDVTQATGASMPTYSVTSFNGRPGITGDGIDDYLTLEPVPAGIPTGSDACEIWALVDQLTAFPDTETRVILGYGGGSTSNRIVTRVVSDSTNRASASVGEAAGAQTSLNTSVEFSGPHIVRVIIDGSIIQTIVDRIEGPQTAATAPTTSSTRLRIFAANAAGTASNFLNGILNTALIVAPLSVGQASLLYAFLSKRL